MVEGGRSRTPDRSVVHKLVWYNYTTTYMIQATTYIVMDVIGLQAVSREC